MSARDLAREVGIRAGNADPLGKRSHLVRTIDRLAHDGIVVPLDNRVLGVRVALPPLSNRALSRLPEPAREAHCALIEQQEKPPD